MTWATEKIKEASKKIVLFELDIPAKEGALSRLLNYEAGIWFATITPEYIIEVNEGVIELVENPVEDDGLDVGSLTVNSEQFIKVGSIEELRLQSEAFYYDLSTTKLYIHFAEWHKPKGFNWIDYIILGMTTGYSSAVDSTSGCYYNDVEYPPRIQAVPNISKQKDPLFFGIVAFNGGAVTLSNQDGYFDKFKDLNIYNQSARIKLGFDGLDFSDYRTVFSGYVESYTWDWKKFTIKLNDPRKRLTRSFPKNRFDKTDYPNLNDNDVDSVKPVCYGTVRNAPLLCVNDADEVAVSFQFFLADTEFYDITEVENVYVAGELLDTGNWSANLETGIVTIGAAHCEDNRGDVTADFTGVDIHNALSIMKDIIDKYANIEFIPTNYNTAEYNRCQSVAPDIYLYVNEEYSIIEAIEDACVAADTSFIPQDDGKFTARMYRSDRTPAATIGTDEWLGEPQISMDESKFLSSVTILYNKDQSNDTYRRYHNDTYEEEVNFKYKGWKNKEIETILANEAGAIAKSENVMLFSRSVGEIVKRSTKTQNIDLEIMDIIIGSPASRIGQDERLAKYEVIGINKNLSSFQEQFDLRFIEFYTPEPDPLTYNGILWNDYLWGDRLYQIAGEY